MLAAPSAPGCRAPRLGSSPALPLLAWLLAADLGGQGAPAATPTPSFQTPPNSTPARGAPTGPPWPRSAERPSLGSRRPWPLTGGSHRRLHRHRSLPDSGQRRPRALQSMSRHRPRPGLRLSKARAGAAVQAWLRLALRAAAPAASRPRRAPAPGVCEAAAAAAVAAAAEPAASGAHSRARPLPPPPSWPARPPPARLPVPLPPLRGREVELGTALVLLGGDPSTAPQSRDPFCCLLATRGPYTQIVPLPGSSVYTYPTRAPIWNPSQIPFPTLFKHLSFTLPPWEVEAREMSPDAFSGHLLLQIHVLPAQTPRAPRVALPSHCALGKSTPPPLAEAAERSASVAAASLGGGATEGTVEGGG